MMHIELREIVTTATDWTVIRYRMPGCAWGTVIVSWLLIPEQERKYTMERNFDDGVR